MQKIFVLGDSISIQYGPYLETYLNGIMSYSRKEGDAEARLNLDNPQGANGGDSSMVLAYLRTMQIEGKIDADFLLLNCGLHDIKTNTVTAERQVPLDQYCQNLRAIIELVAMIDSQLLWVRTTPCDERIHNTRPNMAFHRFAADCDTYNQAADMIMIEAGIHSIDLHTFTQNLSTEPAGADLYYDHVHFHDPICQLQAAFIAGWLSRR